MYIEICEDFSDFPQYFCKMFFVVNYDDL
jgi:hypothetical protein